MIDWGGLVNTCVVREGGMTAPNGTPIVWLYDLRPLLYSPCLADIARSFWSEMKRYLPFQMVGSGDNAVVLMAAFMLADGIPPVNMAVVRREKKKYGRQRVVEGELNDYPIVLVDDICNSAATFERIRVSLTSTHAMKIKHSFVVLSFLRPNAIKWHARNGVMPHALAGAPDELF